MADKKYNVAVLGATGNVGRLLLEILYERKFPFANLKLLASERSVGKKLFVYFDDSENKYFVFDESELEDLKKLEQTKDSQITNRNLNTSKILNYQASKKIAEHSIELACDEAFKDVDIVYASAGAKVSEKLAPAIVKAGALLIDNTSFFRMHPDVPLVVPEVNADDIKKHKGIIANPNCSTAPLVAVLKPLDREFGVKRVVVSTYQSISGAGKEAMDELRETARLSLDGKSFDKKVVNQKIAFNLIPQIDVFTENAYTKEEMKLINESKKMLGRADLKVTCTAIRVPVMICHSESVNIEFNKAVTPDAVRKILSTAPALEVLDEPENKIYPMPLDVEGKDPVYVGRIRADESQANTINMWIVSDNLRIGAALNAIRIGEKAIEMGVVKQKVS